MKRNWLALLGLVLCLSGPASGQDILDGWYWNPNESGWGVNVEVQGDTMFIAVFTYLQDGTPVWYYGVSKINYSDPVFDANLGVASGGACFTCPYMPPGFDDNGGGRMRIDFDSPSGIRVTWQGRTTTIQRQYWAFGIPNDFLFGLWGLIRGIEVPFADYYLLDSRQTDNSGTPFVGGEALDDSLIVAEWFQNIGSYAMLNRKTTGDWYYEFQMTKELMIGDYWIMDIGENPTGPGLDFIAFRVGQQEIPAAKAGLARLAALEKELTPVQAKSLDKARLARFERLRAKADAAYTFKRPPLR